MKMDLSGDWGFALDPDRRGIEERWFKDQLAGEIKLPGSTDELKVGERILGTDTFRLNREYKYIGVAWYQREIEVPEAWRGKRITLFLERCMWGTKLWLNDSLIGSENSLCTPHIYEIGTSVAPGKYLLTIRVDNSAQVDLGTWSHGWSEEVQTIWNGIIGAIELRASDLVFMNRLQVYPDVPSRKVKVKSQIVNLSGSPVSGTLDLCLGTSKESVVAVIRETFSSGNQSMDIETEIGLGDSMHLWDEFEPNLYTLSSGFEASNPAVERTYKDQMEIRFGMRDFSAEGPQFALNGNKVLLRGTHDAGNFPLTGYPSMDKEDWLRIYRIGKSYGLNHFRFHSWCPPLAAFEAADEVGIILQPELPLFGNETPPIGKDANRDDFLHRELDRILDEYGNHPSFCLMCMGNELRGDYRLLENWVNYGRQKDPRHLYASVANNAAEPREGIKPGPADQYYVAHEARVDGKRIVRRCELTFNAERPETASDYGYTLHDISVPTISHEVGQWAVYPDYNEITKYTGVLRPHNLEVFRKSLGSKGMLDQSELFKKASGALSVLLYREEIEKSLRTPNYGGFQLLDIHDYPGQGTSLVGWLDAFWDSKGLIEPERFRRFCAPVVLLLRMKQRVFTNLEVFVAEVDVANYSRSIIDNVQLTWSITDAARNERASGVLTGKSAGQGEVARIGSISVPLEGVSKAERFTIEVAMLGTDIANDWSFWVYPSSADLTLPSGVVVTDHWDTAEEMLKNGRSVLFLAIHARGSETASFTPPFWNTQLFPYQPKTMGLLCDPAHPALVDFPTDDHTDWQWWELFESARAVYLDGAPEKMRPIVQSIHHPVENNRLGLLFEARIGQGKVIVCGFDLESRMEERPVARQLLSSLLGYMGSPHFAPVVELDASFAKGLLSLKPPNTLAGYVKSIQASSSHWTGNPEHLTNGERESFWMSLPSGYPHEVVFELHKEVHIKGFKYAAKQGGQQGWIQSYEWYISHDGQHWGETVAKGDFLPETGEQTVRLLWINDGFNSSQSKKGRFIRLVALSGFFGDSSAAAAELDIIVD